MIKHFTRDQIDESKWDSTIDRSPNGIIYAYSWYLDIVSPDWEALVWGDYEKLFPLTHRRKYKIHYLFQPYFTQQLGPFSISAITSDETSKFLNSIPSKFKLVDIQLNCGVNHINNPDYKVEIKSNYVLDLEDDYTTISSRYSSQLKKNLSKAKRNGLRIEKSVFHHNLDMFKQTVGNSINDLGKREYSLLDQLVNKINEKGWLLSQVCLEVDEVCSGALFYNQPNRIVYILPFSTENGRKLGAMPFLLDSLIRQNAGRNCVLDFEGSQISGIAKFFSSFGSKKLQYLHITKNNLPKPIKWFKK